MSPRLLLITLALAGCAPVDVLDDPLPFDPDAPPSAFPEGVSRQVVCPGEPDRFTLALDDQVRFTVRTDYATDTQPLEILVFGPDGDLVDRVGPETTGETELGSWEWSCWDPDAAVVVPDETPPPGTEFTVEIRGGDDACMTYFLELLWRGCPGFPMR